MKIFVCICIVGLAALTKVKAQVNIVPMPVSVKEHPGYFTINYKTIILATPADKNAKLLNEYLKKLYGFSLPVQQKLKNKAPHIVFSKNKRTKDTHAEGYTLNISPQQIVISSATDAGAFYGMQTLIQLLPAQKQFPYKVQALEMNDYPRFGYRGMHLDVARHYFPLSYIKKYIDYLAMHKMNNFHWHLTDDQGWRIEIKKYPLLTQVGGCRNQTLAGRYGSDKYDSTKYCGFYTQEQIKEVIHYAAERHINVIPEIEMPGHALAAITAYPQLSCTPAEPKKVAETWGVFEDIICPTEYSFHFLQDVLTEVIDLFPSKYIHIGGDEAPKEAWKKSSFAQQLIKEKNLKDEHELQSYFIQRIEKFINSKGRKIIGWNEILEGGLAPNATVMSWQGEKGGIQAANMGHDVIMTPESPLYFDHAQTRNEDSLTRGNYNPLEKVYAYNPIPSELSATAAKHILGAQGNLWTEYVKNGNKVDYMVFPRMSALAEVLWTPLEKKNWQSFEERLPVMMKRYELWNASYSTAWYDLQPAVVAGPNHEITWKLETRRPGAKIIYVQDSTTSASYNYTGPVKILNSGTYGATTTDSQDKIIGKWTWQSFQLNKASGKKISLTSQPNASYAANGAFSLIDGIQNTQGMVKSMQFLGFNGKDMEALIDLGSPLPVNEIILHAFEQTGSWIYRPSQVSFYTSNDGENFDLVTNTLPVSGEKNLVYKSMPGKNARFIKVYAKNYGKIPSGQPGAGSNAWLFADEIEVK